MIKTIYLSSAQSDIKKIMRRIKKRNERSGPIYGFFDIENGKSILKISGFIDKTRISARAYTHFKFTKLPREIKIINEQLEHRSRYIGTWHTHPQMEPIPSRMDKGTFITVHNKLMLEKTYFVIFSDERKYELIISGNNSAKKKEIAYEISEL